jgi:hypothetical protein
MKSAKYIIASTLGICICICSCNEENWLREKPMDFYTPENSYATSRQFRQALNFLYDNTRYLHWSLGDQGAAMHMGDIAYGGTDFPDQKFNNLKTFLTPTTYVSGHFWNAAYNSIANANVILNRIGMPNEVSEEDRQSIEGEALFFRAYYYRLLADLFGGVPVELEESTEPRRDYVRATRDDVYGQIRADLEKAATLLPDIDSAKDGTVSKQAALHLLAETYISLREYGKAIEAASAVIDHPDMALMTSRFGSKANEPGNPYWDLFQLGNQNRSSGNRETILALQYEYQNSSSTYSTEMLRWLLPFYSGARVEGKDGSPVLAYTAFTAEKGGRGIGVLHPTDYFLNGLWGTDFDSDYRNSPSMIVRDFKIDNPEAKGFGEWMIKDGWIREEDTLRQFYPFIMKFSRTGYFPEESYAKNSDGSLQTTALGEHPLINSNNSCNYSFKDEYLFRLAGTYLLRAEAYLGNGRQDEAAADINTVRARANAQPVDAARVDQDYILDEQMRELYFEDFRLQTLCRRGKLVERGRKYNPCGYNIGDHQNLFPIPYSEIERNIFVVIEQNPGYN